MMKVVRRKYKDQIGPNQSKVSNNVDAKRKEKVNSNAKLFEQNKFVCDSEVYDRPSTIQEQIDVSILNEKCQMNKFPNKRKTRGVIRKDLAVCNTELIAQKPVILKSKQTKNKVEAECKGKVVKIVPITRNRQSTSSHIEPSENIKCKTLSCCYNKLLNCDVCSSSFLCNKELEHHKETAHRVIRPRMSMELRQRSRTNEAKKCRSIFPRNQKKQKIIHTTCDEEIFEYFHGQHNTQETLNNINLANTIHTVVSEQEHVISVEKKHTGNLSMVQKSQKTIRKDGYVNNSQSHTQESKVLKSKRSRNKIAKDRILKTSRKKCNNDEESNNIELPDKVEFNCVQEFKKCTYRNHFDTDNQMVVPNVCKEIFVHDTTPEQHIHKDQDPDKLVFTSRKRKCSVLAEENLMNSLDKHVKTKSTMKQKHIQVHKDNSAALNIPEIEASKSGYKKNQALKKFKENMSEFLPEDCIKEETASKTKTSQIFQIKHETLFKRNLQMASHFHNESSIDTCNLYNDTFFCDKALKEYSKTDYPIVNTISQQEEKSSKSQTNENVTQTILRPSLSSGCNISTRRDREDTCAINKSNSIGKLKRDIHSKVRKKGILKPEYCFQNLNKKEHQEIHHRVKIYQHNAIETVKEKNLKPTVTKEKKENITNSSTHSVVQKKKKRTRKSDIKVNKDLVAPTDLNNTTKLIVPLIKLEDLPLVELSKLLVTPNYIENKSNSSFQGEKTTHYQTRDIMHAQYSVYKESFEFRNIEVNKNEKTNIRNKRVKKCQEQMEARIIKEKVANTYMGQTVETSLKTVDVISINQFNKKEIEQREIKERPLKNNTFRLSKMKQYSATESIHSQTNNHQPMVNMSLTNHNNDNEGKAELPDSSNNKSKPKRTKLIVCKICSKRYKRHHAYVSHVSKHTINSNTDICEKQQIQGALKSDNIIKFEDRMLTSDICTKDRHDLSTNYEDNCKLNLITASTCLEQKQYISISEVISDEPCHDENKNRECIKKKENIALDTNGVPNYNYILRVNLRKKVRKGIERQKPIKFNVTSTIKSKTNDPEEEMVDIEVKDKFQTNCIPDTNSTFDTSKEENITYVPKEKYCNICDKKFNSPRLLKEHMFFLHDSNLEGQEISNLLTPYLNDYHKKEKIFTQCVNKFKTEYDTSSERKVSRMEEENKICENTNLKTKKRNRKWRCISCEENFALIRNYLRHKYYCHNDESVVHVCDNCNKVLTSVGMVNIHMCTNVTSWNCKRCNLNFANGISLTQHNINCHLEIIGPHVCNMCNLSFLTIYMLERHKTTHSNNHNYSNVNYFINVPISVENNLSHNLNNTSNFDNEFSKKSIKNNTVTTCNNKNITISSSLNKINESPPKKYVSSNIIFLPYDDEQVFKCKLCNILCLTKLQIKLHLERWHDIKVEMCQFCNDLYVIDELTKHLINHHIVLENLNFKEDNINSEIKQEKMVNFSNDIVKSLGLNRLLSLYEYQRFDNIPKNECFNCIICSREFSNIHHYKIHYLEFHDMICLLCNIEFEHNFQAFEHKKKIHVSIDSYLWVVDKIITAILQLNKYGDTIENVILQFSETRMCDGETMLKNEQTRNFKQNIPIRTSESVWFKDYKLDELDTDKNHFYRENKFKNFVELPEVGNANIIIIDDNNSNSLKNDKKHVNF